MSPVDCDRERDGSYALQDDSEAGLPLLCKEGPERLNEVADELDKLMERL